MFTIVKLEGHENIDSYSLGELLCLLKSHEDDVLE